MDNDHRTLCVAGQALVVIGSVVGRVEPTSQRWQLEGDTAPSAAAGLGIIASRPS
jgi:hypothetical protein